MKRRRPCTFELHMMPPLRLVLWLGVASACSHPGAPSVPATTPASPVAVSPPGDETPAPDVLDLPSRPPPPEARALLAATNELVSAMATLDHAPVVEALVRFADALELLVPDREADIESVRDIAGQLERSPEESLEHANLVRAALSAGLRALDSAKLPDGVDPMSIHALRLREARLAARNAINAFDVDRPLLDQFDLLRVTMREATRAVYAALIAPEPDILVHTSRR